MDPRFSARVTKVVVEDRKPGLAKRRALFPEGRGLGVGGRKVKVKVKVKVKSPWTAFHGSLVFEE